MRKQPLPGAAVHLAQRFADALVLSAEVHRDQLRKGTRIPYVAHTLAVAALVLEAGGDEEQAVAALLHDALEDQPERVTAERIEGAFGPRVRRIVEECSDLAEDEPGDRSAANWEKRKGAYLKHLREGASPDALLVSCADKVHNARSIVRDLREQGAAIWTRFRTPAERQRWYYRALVDAFRSRSESPAGLVEELDVLVTEMERSI